MNIEELSEKVYIDLNGRITSVEDDEELVTILFQCDDWDESDNDRNIIITCSGVVEFELKPSMSGDIDFYNEHPLLWKFNEDHGYLYYSSEADSKYELLGRIWEAHELVMNGWRPVSEFINTTNRESQIEFCLGKSGLLADGPKPLLEAYKKAVNGLVDTNYVPSYQLNGNMRVLIFDYGYVICNSVGVVDESSS